MSKKDFDAFIKKHEAREENLMNWNERKNKWLHTQYN